MEEWRSIKGFEGYYEVSNLGRVRSLDRYVTCNNGVNVYNRFKKGVILKTGVKGGGYLFVGLHKDGCKTIEPSVHRLVAEAFIPNPENLPEVNHKDENKTNNSVDNLEWCTRAYNTNYGTRGERYATTRKKNYVKEEHPFFGKHHTEETKKKLSVINKKYTDEELKQHARERVDKNREKYREYWRRSKAKKRLEQAS